MAPKGLPKSGGRWDFGEGGLWESAKHKQGSWPLGLGPMDEGSTDPSRCQELKKTGAQKTLVLRWFTGVYKIPLL